MASQGPLTFLPLPHEPRNSCLLTMTAAGGGRVAGHCKGLRGLLAKVPPPLAQALHPTCWSTYVI